MEHPEINFTLKLTSEMIEAIADRVVERQRSAPLPNMREHQTFFTVKEVAEMVGKKPATITKHCRIGLLKAEKTGKSYTITLDNLKDYIYAK